MEDFKVSVKLEAVDGNIAQLRKDVEEQFNSPINVKFGMGELGKASGVRAVSTGLGGIANQLNRCRVNLNTLNGAQKINSLDMKKATAVMKTYGQYYDVSTKKSKSETAEITKQTAALNLSNKQRLEAKRLITDGNAARDKAFKTEAAFIRLQNQARSFYTKNQANIADKGGDAAWRASIAKYGDATQWVSAAEAQADFLRQQKSWVEQGVTGQTKVNKALLRARELTDFSKLEEQARDYYNTNYQNINKNAVLSARWQSTMAKMQDPTKFGATEAERIGNARSELAALRNESERAGVSIETLGQRLSRLFGAHFNTALVMGALHALQQSLVMVYQNVVGLDKATVDLQIASGKSRSEVKDMVRDYSQTAKSLGATTLEVAQSSDTWLRQGKTVQEANTLIQNSMMLSKLGQIDAETSAQSLTSAMKGYNVSVEDSIKIVDKLTAVDQVSASSAGGLAVSMSETAVSARMAGVSMDKLLGQLAAIKETTQDSDEAVGNFAKTMYARMGNVKAGELIDPESGEILSNVESVLTGYGITLRDSNSEFRNFGDVLDEVASRWDTFGSVAQRAIAVAFSGTRQQEKFLVLMQQYKEALKYEDIAAGSDGTAQKKFSEAYLGGVEAHVNTLKAAYESLSMTVLNSDTVNGILNTGTAIVSIFDKVIQVAGLMPTLAGGVGAYLGLSGQGIFSGKNPFERNWLTAADKTKVGGVNSWIAAQMALPDADLAKIKQSQGWIDQLNSLPTEKARQFASALDGTEYSMRGVMTLGQSVVSTIKNIGSAMATAGAYAAVMWVVGKGIELVSNAMNAEAVAIDDLNKKQQKYQQTQDSITAAQNEQAAIRARLAELSNVEFKSVDEQSQVEELRAQNAELTRKLQLLKETAIEEEKSAKAASEKAWKSSVTAGTDSSYDASGKKLNWFSRALLLNSQSEVSNYNPDGFTTPPQMVFSRVEAANLAMQEYNALRAEQIDLEAKINSGTATSAESKRYDAVNAQIETTASNLVEINTALAASGSAQANPIIDRISYTMGTYADKVSVFSNTLSTLTGDEQQRNLIALANAGKLTGESLKDIVGVDTLTKLVALTGSTGNVLTIIKAIAAESASAASSVTSVGTGLSASFETVKTSVTNLTAQYSALSAAQKQQATDGYLTIDTLNALADAGIEYRDAIEPVDSLIEGQTGAYRVNLDTLAQTVEANNQYERGLIELKKAAALNEIQTLKNKDVTDDLTDAEQEQLATAKERVALYDELAKGLDNMSKASTAYKIALETENASSSYDYGTGTIFKTITDGLNSGRIATDEFKAALSFFTDGQFGDSITQDDIPAIQAFADSIADFTQGGAAGLNAATEKFRTALWSGGKGILDENGQFKEGVTLADAAAALGENVGTEFTYSLLKSYEDYGFDVNLKKLMQDEDWQMVADMMGEKAKPLLDTYTKLTGLYAQDQTEEVQNQIRNIMNTLSVDDLNKMIGDYQAAIESGEFKGPQLDGLKAAQGSLNDLLTEKQAFDSEIQLAVEDNASPVLSKIIGLLAQIHSKTITIKAEFLAGSSLYDDPSPGKATQGIGGRGRASGNANARGTWGRGSGGRTLVGELGPEIVVDPATNRWYTVGDRGAQFANLPQNAIVFNHLQTQSILSQGRLGSRGKALAGGTSAFPGLGGSYDLFGGIGDIGPGKKPDKPKGPKKPALPKLGEVYKSEIKLLEMQIKLTNDLLNMYETGTAKWFSQQQYIIDNYKRQAVLAQAEYDRLIASGADIKSEEVQSVLQSLVGYRKEIFEASKDYWEAEKDNANSTLEHMKAQAQAVMDLQESYHELTKSIQAEQRSIDSELRIASEAYPNLTSAEREAAFSGDDYRLLSNRLAVIAAEAANMQADYMQQIKDVGEESSYELESITDEFKKQYELKLDAYNVAKNELAVLKAKKNLENVQSERSVAMLIGGMWTWVADAEAVADAMRGVTDAQQELADAQSDATFNAEQANISSVINQIDDQIGAIDALVYSSDALAEEVHSLVATIQDQVLAAMSPSSAAMLAALPTYAGTSTGLFGTSALQTLLAASLSGSGSVYTPTSSLGVDLSSILGNMGSVRPSISVSSSPTGDIVSIGQLTITGAVASQFIALLRSVAPLG